MANSTSLVEKLDQNFLECGICLERFQNPRGLPCLHSFCHSCLETLCTEKQEIHCPNCKKLTSVPEEGVSGFPAHFLVNSLKETIDIEKLKLFGETPSQTTQCGACKDPKKDVSVRCLDCNLFLCAPCHKSHDGFQPMQNHQIVSVDIASNQSLIPVSTPADQVCTEHDGEAKRFYCETCGMPVCRDCIVMKQFCRDHEYTTLKDASKKQAAILMELTQQCDTLKSEYKRALKKTVKIESKFDSTVKEEKERAQTVKQKYKSQLESTFNNYTAAVDFMETQRVSEFKDIKDNIKSTLAILESACDLSTTVTQMGSFYDITSMYISLSRALQELGKSPTPVTAHDKLGEFQVLLPAYPELPKEMYERNEVWTLVKQFNTCPEMKNPQGIKVNQEGRIALTNYHKKAGVFSMSGDLELTLKGPFCNQRLYDVAFTPDEGYALPANGGLLLYDSNGIKIKNLVDVLKTHNNKTTYGRAIAVDSAGKMILALDSCTISIHKSIYDASVISRFHIPSQPCCLAITTEEEIAITFHGSVGALQIMDYNGNNKREIKPQQIKKWNPTGVCCSKQGELFVANNSNPRGVYKFTADGKQCLGRAITGLDDPQGIAITDDGQQLLVAEFSQSLVKIFQRF